MKNADKELIVVTGLGLALSGFAAAFSMLIAHCSVVSYLPLFMLSMAISISIVFWVIRWPKEQGVKETL